MREIGTFNVVGDRLTIGDPGHDDEMHLACQVLRGRWEVKLVDMPNRDAMGVMLLHESLGMVYDDDAWSDPVYSVEVSNSCLAISDERYYGDPDEAPDLTFMSPNDRSQIQILQAIGSGSDAQYYQSVCMVLSSSLGAAAFTHGVAVRTGMGDGCYLVNTHSSLDDHGETKISGIRIDFGALAGGHYREIQVECPGCRRNYDGDELTIDGFCSGCADKPFCNACNKIVDHVDDNGYCDACFEESNKPEKPISLLRCEALYRLGRV